MLTLYVFDDVRSVMKGRKPVIVLAHDSVKRNESLLFIIDAKCLRRCQVCDESENLSSYMHMIALKEKKFFCFIVDAKCLRRCQVGDERKKTCHRACT